LNHTNPKQDRLLPGATDLHKVFADFFPDERIRPLAYLLAKRLQDGHVCLTREALLADTEHPYGAIQSLPEFKRMKNLVALSEEDPPAPFVFSHDRIYFHRYFQYETQILNKIKALQQKTQKELPKRRKLIESLKQSLINLAPTYSIGDLLPAEKTDWQLVSVIQCLLHDFSIITGGPGTGKTTTLANLLLLLFQLEPSSRIALAAPTGKASMRMLQSLGEKSASFPDAIKAQIKAVRSSTIHALLGNQRHSIYFKYHEKNPLPYDWIIIDEASMIDMPLFAKLLSAMGESCRLVLLGDKDQLASVEAGSLLGDLCQSVPKLNRFDAANAHWINQFIAAPQRHIDESFFLQPGEPGAFLQEAIVELKLSHRFQERGLIGRLSKAVIQNRPEDLTEMIKIAGAQELQFASDQDPKHLNQFILGYASFLKEQDIRTALQNFNKLRVLVTVKQGDRGLYAVNRLIEKMLGEAFGRWINPSPGFYINRPVMITRNNYELGLFNGDVGILRPDPEGQLRAWFPDENSIDGIRSVLPAYLTGCETVFAMTIHKSQGSEFNEVMVILPEQADHRLLTRELIYTGITRARNRVVIQGSEAVIFNGMARSVERSSGLQVRLNKQP
jgi:exodeoxyribonuclease V alpha subunit